MGDINLFICNFFYVCLLSDGVGRQFYEMAMAPGYHAQMGMQIENEMFDRELAWKRKGQPSISCNEEESEED